MARLDDRYLWTKHLMPIVYKLGQTLKARRKKLLISLPLTWETLCLIDAIKDKLKITVIPLTSGKNSSLQPIVLKYLKKWKIKYFEKATDLYRIEALKEKPDIILDCLFTVSELALKENLISPNTLLIEDTRTGAIKLKEALKKYAFPNPYFVLDDNRFKQDYENRVGIGYSIVGAIIASGILLKGKTVVIIGFGPVGQGLAEFSKGMGAKVNIVDIDPQKRILAKNTYESGALKDFLETGDVFITATGKTGVLKREHLLKMKDGAILVNAGADVGEWDQVFLYSNTSIRLTDKIVKFVLKNGKHLLELGGGNSYNLVSGISISNFLDITFSLALLAIERFAGSNKNLHGQLMIRDERLQELTNHIGKIANLN